MSEQCVVCGAELNEYGDCVGLCREQRIAEDQTVIEAIDREWYSQPEGRASPGYALWLQAQGYDELEALLWERICEEGRFDHE